MESHEKSHHNLWDAAYINHFKHMPHELTLLYLRNLERVRVEWRWNEGQTNSLMKSLSKECTCAVCIL